MPGWDQHILSPPRPIWWGREAHHKSVVGTKTWVFRRRKHASGFQFTCRLLASFWPVAHSDVPVESSQTRLLSFSQHFRKGDIKYRLPEFTQYVLENYISLPLGLGDGLFFNPALLHAAAENLTGDMMRSANLLQVSSSFTKPMESLDSISLIERCWHILNRSLTRKVQALSWNRSS